MFLEYVTFSISARCIGLSGSILEELIAKSISEFKLALVSDMDLGDSTIPSCS